jgi:hypothetical protein
MAVNLILSSIVVLFPADWLVFDREILIDDQTVGASIIQNGMTNYVRLNDF